MKERKELTNGPNDAKCVIWACFCGSADHLLLSKNNPPTCICSKGGSVTFCLVSCNDKKRPLRLAFVARVGSVGRFRVLQPVRYIKNMY